MLEISNLSIQYSQSSEWALKEISLSFPTAGLFLIAGPSGSGKSTLAQAILGMIPIMVKAHIDGIIKINDQLLTTIDRKKLVSLMGYVPQYPADYTTTIVVEEEIAFPCENLGIPRHEIASRIERILNILNINALRHRLITELSAGELQRVAIATAIVLEPPILILDEPMARIDSATEINLVQFLHQFAQNGHCVLVFEHRLDYLLPIADRVVLLEKGSLVAEGSPKAVLNQMSTANSPEFSQIAIVPPELRLNYAEVVNFLTKFFANSNYNGRK